MMDGWRSLGRDARDWQIAALSSLILVNFVALDFGARPLDVAAALSSVALVQMALNRLTGAPLFDLKSALITGCSLSLLLRVEALWLYPLAALIGLGGKCLLRFDDRHLFNPAALAIAITTALSPLAWISPAQWGTTTWLLALAGLLGVAVLTNARRADITLAFLGAFALFLFGRALWLGDPLAIPLLQVQSGALLIFACFMISDPRTTPVHRLGRILFAAIVAALALALLVEAHSRSGLIWALVFAAPLVPVINRLFPAPAHRWTPAPEEEKEDELASVGDPGLAGRLAELRPRS